MKSSSAHWQIRVLLHRLVTLPSPVPFLTRHAYADYLRFAVFAALNILFGYNRVKYTTDYKLYGWLALANGGLALLLGARTNLLSLVLRVPSPVLLAYHRLVGRAVLVHATLHFALTADHYVRTEQLATVLANTYIQAGLVAFASICILFLTSIGPIRRRWFEAFYYPHFFFLVFVVGALIHTYKAVQFLLPGLILWGLDRAVRFANNFRTLSVASIAHYPGDVTKIRVEGLERTHPGQIAFVQLPGVSFLNWHPFTIASAPQDSTATFAIRGLGGFTNKVQRLAAEAGGADAMSSVSSVSMMARDPSKPTGGPVIVKPGADLKIRLDGPYGTGALQYEQFPVVAIVAGGIGITPGISIASHIVRRAASRDANEPARNRWHVHLLWVVKDGRHASWFEAELRNLDALVRASAGRATLDVHIFVTGREGGRGRDAESSFAMEAPYSYAGPGVVVGGRPDLDQWFAGVAGARRGMDVAVNLCGPGSLINGARRAAARASGRDGLFHVEEEVFEF